MSEFDEINAPFTKFFIRTQEKIDKLQEIIRGELHKLDVAIKATTEEFKDVIVGEPEIKVEDYDMSEITVTFNTNVPVNTDETDEDEDTAADVLERKVFGFMKKLLKINDGDYFDYDKLKKRSIHFSLDAEKENSTCVISLTFDINFENEDIFDDWEADLYKKIFSVVSDDLKYNN
jgi:uncharacterized protein YdhG (YjbR/CyaY superfamily)